MQAELAADAVRRRAFAALQPKTTALLQLRAQPKAGKFYIDPSSPCLQYSLGSRLAASTRTILLCASAAVWGLQCAAHKLVIVDSRVAADVPVHVGLSVLQSAICILFVELRLETLNRMACGLQALAAGLARLPAEVHWQTTSSKPVTALQV